NVSLCRTTHLALARHYHSPLAGRLWPRPVHAAAAGRRRRLSRRRRPRNSRPPRLGHPPRKQHPLPRESPASLLGSRARPRAFRRAHLERPPVPPFELPCASVSALFLRPPVPYAAIRFLGGCGFPRILRPLSLHPHSHPRCHCRPVDWHRVVSFP